MSLKSLELELGPLHRIRDVHQFFGCSAEVLRDMCAAGEISPLHVEYTKNGTPRYLIPEQAIKNWRKQHEVRTS